MMLYSFAEACAPSGVSEIQPRLSADDKRADCILAQHVADLEPTVVESADKLRPFIGEIADGLAGQRLRRRRIAVPVEPRPKLVSSGPGSLLAQRVPLLAGHPGVAGELLDVTLTRSGYPF